MNPARNEQMSSKTEKNRTEPNRTEQNIEIKLTSNINVAIPALVQCFKTWLEQRTQSVLT